MQVERRITAIAFDAYGTLFDVFSIGALAEELFSGKGTALATMWRDKQLEYARIRTMCGRFADFWTVTADALDYCCERLGLTADAALQARLMQQYAELSGYPGDLEALHHIKGLGLKVGMLSNGSARMLNSAITAASMDGLFDPVISVDPARRFKTAPEAYQLGPDGFGCPVEEILFVSANGWDVCGATWFGYTTFWLNRAGLPAERLGVEPHATGRTMGEVVRFVEASARR
ncbi:haloacid dehalogenase type II [Geminicoccus flavidas]|uniref:haloacid dehalogenase type II n=1 Tax=Geminicoccus flavidas TaxID=2506407 RepID=UPI001356876F|nr:haloacid dehalogenase type II [Geminicoccus flavidas]